MDRSNETTLPLTTPRLRVKSSSRDLSAHMYVVSFVSRSQPGLIRPDRPPQNILQKVILYPLRREGLLNLSVFQVGRFRKKIVASSMDSALEAFRHKPASGGFPTVAFPPVGNTSGS